MEPVPPSQRTELAVPAGLERIIMSCLEKEPDARPASASELDRMLADCQVDRPWTEEQASSWWETHLPKSAA